MKKILLALLTLTSISAFAETKWYDEQVRNVYSSSTDNVCNASSDINDKIRIDVVLNGDLTAPFKKYVTHGAVSCKSGGLPKARLDIGKRFEIYNPDSGINIAFNETQQNKLDKINIKSTVINPVKIDGITYTCSIMGDGTVSKYNDTTIILNCM